MSSRAAVVSEATPPIDKVREILGAARQVFLQHGFAAASMDAVARKAGVGKATLYIYFAGKNELFEAVILEERDRFAVSLLSGAASRESTLQKLQRFGEAIVAFLISDDVVASYRMVVAEAGRVPELGRAFYLNGPSKLLDRLEDFMLTSMQSGALREADPRRAAEHLIDLVRGDLQLCALLGVSDRLSRRRRTEVIRAGVDMFYRAYAPPPKRGSSVGGSTT